MAFLDNSGDIILDAVLTKLGRKRLAQGRGLRIRAFGLGDDEIDYGLYDINHPSGSAYYDLKILQRPVMTATTDAQSANINYGLRTIARNDLLYLPIIKVNDLIQGALNSTGSIYYVACNNETAGKLATNFGDKKYRLVSGEGADTSLFLESGLDTTDLVADASKRQTHIINTGMLDKTFSVYADTRFIGGMMGPPKTAYHRNTSQGSLQSNMGPLRQQAGGASAYTSLKNYNTFTVNGVDDLVYYYNTATDDSSIDPIRGPRGTITAMVPVVDAELTALSTGQRSSKFNRFGTINSTLFVGTEYYDWIDTTVYVQGSRTLAKAEIIFRLIRYAGT
jgi:hypothetical protein